MTALAGGQGYCPSRKPSAQLSAGSSLRLKNGCTQDDAPEGGGALHRIRLLFRQIANHWQLVHLPLIRLDKQDNPDDEAAQTNQKVKRESEQGQKWHDGENRESDVENKQCRGEKQALPRVKADETIFVVGFHQQENDRWNNGDVGQHSCDVVRHAPSGRRGSGPGCDSTRAYGTGGGAVRDLCAAHVAKGHRGILQESFGIEGMRPCSVRETAAKRCCGKVPKRLRQSNRQFRADISRTLQLSGRQKHEAVEAGTF